MIDHARQCHDPTCVQHNEIIEDLIDDQGDIITIELRNNDYPVEEKLSKDYRFMRVRHSFVVNLNEIGKHV